MRYKQLNVVLGDELLSAGKVSAKFTTPLLWEILIMPLNLLTVAIPPVI